MTLEELKSTIEESGLFDKKFYLKTYRDARRADGTPLDHFVKVGLKEDRKPNQDFNPVWYREYYEDIKNDGIYPFIHYILFGKDEGRRTFLLKSGQKNNLVALMQDLDQDGYLQANPDVQEAIKTGGFDSIEHYLDINGLKKLEEGLNPFHKDFKPFNFKQFKKLFSKVIENENSSPFDYFCRIGYKKIINREVDWDLSETTYVIPKIVKSDKLLGNIGEYENGRIKGWCYADQDFDILLMINNRSCKIIKSNISMPRVAKNFNLDREDVGFIAEITDEYRNANEISLYAIFENSCQKIISTNKFSINNVSPRSLAVLKDLKEVSIQKNSVAIVIWDVTHNPIGRAKVLYDIVKKNNPVVMIGFNFGLSKSAVWDPIVSSDLKLISINWDERELYGSLMREMNISFETVWICKPRLPSYVLADMFSTEETKFILDIDDNESEMSQSNASLPKPYGALGNHLAESFTEKIDAKSVASISIQERWGGEFVRHARIAMNPENIRKRTFLPNKIKIGFFGTIRPHKNIHKAAEIISNLEEALGIQLEFHVGGHFYPNEIRDTIESFGAKTYGMIPNNELIQKVNEMDVLLTGFPLDTEENEITKYQISSKIGDALGMGRPVLVPKGSSVKDLENIAGIYLFDENNFSEKLLDAIRYKEEISLPYNYMQFMELKKIASKQKKSEIFDIPLLPYAPYPKKEHRPTLILLWKQPDSTLYGRRVDQIARSYKRKYPEHRVILLETINDEQEKYYEEYRDSYIGDSPLIIERLREKRSILEIEGIEHIVLDDTIFKKENNFRTFLLSNRMLPDNTMFILFPMIGYFETFFRTINGYRYVADIVDNQLGWKSSHPHKIVEQYKILSSNAEYTIFNSDNNRNFFHEHGLLDKDNKDLLITNWYELPLNRKENKLYSKNKGKHIRIFYSGNMNDRIDWNLIERLLLALPDNVTLYLIGNALRSGNEIKELISKYKNCQFLGPIDERNLISFIETCHFSIMPHTVEATSKYMNPLKIHMFAALGIECISTNVPGLENRFKNLTICENQDTFVKECLQKIKIDNARFDLTSDLTTIYSGSRDKYIDLLSKVLTHRGDY